MDDIILSIIIPVYNAEKTILNTIESLLKQNLENVEILLINDGSTDNSIDLLKNINNQNLKIVNQENKGVSSARNNGIKRAKGKYLTFIDSDDLIRDSYIDDIKTQIEKSDYDLIIYSYEEIENNSVINKVFVKEEEYKDVESCFYNTINNGVYWMSVWNKVYKSALVKDIMFNSEITNGEDFEFNIKYLSKVGFENISIRNSAFYCYNIAPGLHKYRKDSLKTRIYITELLINTFKSDILRENAFYYFWNSVIYDLISIVENNNINRNNKIELFKILKIHNNFRKYKISKKLTLKKKIQILLIKVFGYKFAYYSMFLYLKI